jgi:hypothetical protein
MRAAESTADTLQHHIAGTYFALRLGMGVIAVLLPLSLWLGGRVFDGEGLRCSMSAYYHSASMRDVFVGALVAIGACLYLYKGFSTKENVALNLAGALAVGIALVPTGANCGDETKGLTAHAVFAVLFFVTIAYVAIRRADDTLSLVRDAQKAERLRLVYRVLGVGMLLSPVVAVIIAQLFQRGREQSSLVFFIEALAVWLFAAFWLVKSRELKATDADRLVLERKLQAQASAKRDTGAAPGSLVQVTPDDEIPM